MRQFLEQSKKQADMAVVGVVYEVRGQSKKVSLDLGHVEKCGFFHGVQHVSNIIFQVFLGVEKF